jgi:HEPN domain-containing protein
MNAPPELVRLTRQWLGKADEDLINAEYVMSMREHCPLGTVCFHAQQCAEKYLKAFLCFHSVPVRKTHDLLDLLVQVRKIRACQGITWSTWLSGF